VDVHEGSALFATQRSSGLIEIAERDSPLAITIDVVRHESIAMTLTTSASDCGLSPMAMSQRESGLNAMSRIGSS